MFVAKSKKMAPGEKYKKHMKKVEKMKHKKKGKFVAKKEPKELLGEKMKKHGKIHHKAHGKYKAHHKMTTAC